MGVVYILTNEAMPNKVKIGSTGNLEQRIKSLDNTSIPIPFECFFAIEVPNAEEVERKLHKIFAKDRIRSNREFFDILPESAKEALELTGGKDVTPGNMIVESEEDKVALEKAQRERFKFSLLDIKPGTILTFSKDENITCEVLDDKLVKYKDREMSLSASALEIVTEMGYTWGKISGPDYWQLDGKSLYQMRIERDV